MGLTRCRAFLAGMLAAFLLTGCAALGFHYKYYGVALVSYEQGSLLGPTASDDLPISVCQPDAQGSGKCVVMLASEFYALKADYLEVQQLLSACQKP